MRLLVNLFRENGVVLKMMDLRYAELFYIVLFIHLNINMKL